MGHERLGLLPKTKRWRAIVTEIAGADTSRGEVPKIASHTLQALGSRYVDLASDPSVKGAFSFLVDLARAAAGKPGPIFISRNTPLSVATELAKRLEAVEGSFETSAIVRRAAADAIATWSRGNATTQSELFADSGSSDPWKSLGTGAGFCELSGLFFSRLTERYLGYFLDREASAVLPHLQSRENFRRHLQEHIGEVSRHSFETAKITQSFAAGWFHKNAVKDRPSAAQIHRFLLYAFEKLREDLRREDRQ